MNRLFESLLNHYGFKTVAGGLGAVGRTWSKEVDVAWHGRQTELYKVIVHPWGADSAKVSFMRNGRLEKQKIYASGSARALNAIRQTVKYAGYEF